LVASVKSNDGIVIVDDEEEEAVGEIEQDDNDEALNIQIISSFVEEKTSAIRTIGSICRFTKYVWHSTILVHLEVAASLICCPRAALTNLCDLLGGFVVDW
jgi:hypothetical protein